MAKRKFSTSLVRRILSICIVLIVLPLILYSIIIWDRDVRIKFNTIFSELRLVGNASLEIYNEWLALQKRELEDFINDENTSMMFIFDENFEVVFSSEKTMEGTRNFFQSEIKRAFQEGSLVFAARNPYTNREEVFVLHRVGNEIRGLSTPATLWAKRFIQEGKFDLSLVDNKGKIIFSTAPQHSQDLIFNSKDPIGFFKIHTLKNRRLALSLNPQQALFTLQIELSGKQMKEFEGGRLFHILIELILIIIVLGGIGTWLLIKKMARPFNQLTQVMDAVEAKDYESRYHEDRFGFEINDLGLKFNEMLERLLSNMEEAKVQRVKKELLSKELQIGRSVQKELFPKEIPPFPGIRVGFKVISAKEVGGDFYDLFAIDKDHLMVAIADGSDKGISACLYSLIVRSILRSYSQSEQQLSSVILQTNNLFYHDAGPTSNFVTAWVGFYHVANRSLTYTSAGHLPAILLLPNGEMKELATSGIALGASLVEEVEVKTLQLPAESLLFLYTDGLIETHNEKGELFGKSRLFDFLTTNQNLDPQQLVDKLVAEVGHFAKQTAQHDDLTVLCLKIS